MDPPPLAPHFTTITATATTQHGYPDSVDSSPLFRNIDAWQELLPPVPNAELRVMCSYGGHIIPRPHDKSLCYVGGETRIVVIDRHSSLAELTARLSRTLLKGRQFTLKYQLPTEDLDSLISVSTDEDLDNMIEEYDRTNSSSPLKPSRLRLFLFLAKPETAVSMGSLLDDAKSETWFVDALNSVALLPRGFSDSAAMDCLLGLDGVARNDSCNDLDAQTEPLGEGKQGKNAHDVHSPGSPMLENTSSFGSSSSSPSMSNLPPIRVRVEDGGGVRLHEHKVGAEEKFSQTSLSATVQKHEGATLATALTVHSTTVSGENLNRAFSDDERSDHGAACGFRKPPLPLQPVQRKLNDGLSLPSPDSKHSGGFNLPSPDSVASDSSIASVVSLSKTMFHQDPAQAAHGDNRIPANFVDPKIDISESGSRFQLHQVQESGYILPSRLDQYQQYQQQFIQPSTHYIPHPATGPAPVPSYYPIYAPPSQQQVHHPNDQQYPFYLLPITQNQPYNLSVQANIADNTTAASSRPLPSPSPPMVASSAVYKDTHLPTCSAKAALATKPETAASVYKATAAAATAALPLIQVPSNQFQQQYVGCPQMSHPSQSIAAAAATYAYEYAHTGHEQVYYTQHPAAPLPPQYQTMTSAAAVMLSEASTQAKQLPTDNNKH